MLIIVGPVNTDFTRSVKQSPILRGIGLLFFACKNGIKHGKAELNVIQEDGNCGALARSKKSGVVLYCIE